MAAKEMRIEPARIQRCGLVLENSVRGVCIAPPRWGPWPNGPRRDPDTIKGIEPIRSDTFTILAVCYAQTWGESISRQESVQDRGPQACQRPEPVFDESALCRSPKLREAVNRVRATMLRVSLHAIHFKHILNFGEGQHRMAGRYCSGAWKNCAQTPP